MKLDDVIRGCLAKIRQREMTAVGVLADHLDEISHPLAKKIRTDFDRAERGIHWTATTENWGTRRKKTRWENIALWRRWLWIRIRNHFNRDWGKAPTLNQFSNFQVEK